MKSIKEIKDQIEDASQDKYELESEIGDNIYDLLSTYFEKLEKDRGNIPSSININITGLGTFCSAEVKNIFTSVDVEL